MKAIDKLRATWSKKEKDVMLHFPLGRLTKSDAHWLSGIFTAEFIQELKERGYDHTTMKFEVYPDLKGSKAEYKFPTLLKK